MFQTFCRVYIMEKFDGDQEDEQEGTMTDAAPWIEFEGQQSTAA